MIKEALPAVREALPALQGSVLTPGAPGAQVEPSNTPRRLRRYQVLVAFLVLLAGMQMVLAANGLRTAALSEPQEAILYARLSKVEASLMTATVTAHESALSPAATRTTQSQQVMEQVSQAWDELLEAARARPESAEALKQIGQDILSYSFTLGSISGTNRTEAAGVLPEAQKQLKSITDEVDSLKSELKTEIYAGLPSAMGVLAYLLGIAALGVVIWASIEVARRSHRVLNVGLAGAALGLLLMMGLFAASQQAATDLSNEISQNQLSEIETADTAAREINQAHLMLTSAVLTESWSSTDSTAYADWYDRIKVSRALLGLTQVKVFAPNSDLVTAIKNEDWTNAKSGLLDTARTGPSAIAETYLKGVNAATTKATQAATDAATGADRALISQLVIIALLALGAAAAGIGGLIPRLREYR